ncbi:MAG: cupin domain-containing protein [Bacteroidales bacterium]|nr:cupin domain-containing protein [Bacteroidales bacterium]
MNEIANIEHAEIIFKQEGVTGKLLLKRSKNEFVYLTFDKASETQAHVQDVLMSFYIVTGEATVIIEDQTLHLKKGQLIEIEPGKNRKWINSGSEKLELFVVKTII